MAKADRPISTRPTRPIDGHPDEIGPLEPRASDGGPVGVEDDDEDDVADTWRFVIDAEQITSAPPPLVEPLH